MKPDAPAAFLTLLGLVIGGAACRGSGDAVAIPFGVWAGPEGRLDVDASGALFRLPCALGRVPAPLPLDGDGRFDLSGQYEVQAGPEPFRSLPARFSGHVRGLTLTAEIRREGAPDVIGPLELRLGANPPPLILCRNAG